MGEIKPCPFCGSTDIKLHDEISHAVWCQECFAEMPSIDIESAVELWNTRPIEDALNARIAELEEKQRWRVVANGELPEDGEVVWLWDGKYIGMGYYLVFTGQFMDRDIPLRRIKPTHWMPLPEPPEVK